MTTMTTPMDNNVTMVIQERLQIILENLVTCMSQHEALQLSPAETAAVEPRRTMRTPTDGNVATVLWERLQEFGNIQVHADLLLITNRVGTDQ